MADVALELEHFEFGVGQHDGQEMSSLGGERSGGVLAHRSILLERLMIFFHLPPSPVNRGWLYLVQVGMAADQLQGLHNSRNGKQR